MTFDCPRCDQNADDRFYGPCDSCREELRMMKFTPMSKTVTVEEDVNWMHK